MRNDKRRLGRGLDALFHGNNNEPGQKYIKNNNDQIANISVTEIIFNPNQPRKNFDEEELNNLKNSIIEHGILQPVLLRRTSDGFVVVAGERRCRAAKMANLQSIPAMIIKNSSEQKIFEISLLENIQRSNLSVIEEANAYDVLLNQFNNTHEQVAQAVGKSRSHITNCLRMLKLPSSVVKMLEQGEITHGHAKILATQEDPRHWAQETVDGAMSIKALSEAIKENESSELKLPKQTSINSNSKREEFEIPDFLNLPNSSENISSDQGLKVKSQYQDADFGDSVSVQIETNDIGEGMFIMIKCSDPQSASEVLSKLQKND